VFLLRSFKANPLAIHATGPQASNTHSIALGQRPLATAALFETHKKSAIVQKRFR
jgi:hypothetical protein